MSLVIVPTYSVTSEFWRMVVTVLDIDDHSSSTGKLNFVTPVLYLNQDCVFRIFLEKRIQN